MLANLRVCRLKDKCDVYATPLLSRNCFPWFVNTVRSYTWKCMHMSENINLWISCACARKTIWLVNDVSPAMFWFQFISSSTSASWIIFFMTRRIIYIVNVLLLVTQCLETFCFTQQSLLFHRIHLFLLLVSLIICPFCSSLPTYQRSLWVLYIYYISLIKCLRTANDPTRNYKVRCIPS